MNLRLISGIAVLAISGISSAQFSITDPKLVFGKWDFNGLSTSVTDTAIPNAGQGKLLNDFDSTGKSTGWSLASTVGTAFYRKADTGSAGTTVRVGGTGGSIAGGFYATGLPASGPGSDLSLGSVASGSTGDMYRVLRLKNATGVDLVGNIGFAFTAKTFRRSDSMSPTEGLTFDYGFFASAPLNLTAATGFGKTNLQKGANGGQTDADFSDVTNLDVTPKGSGVSLAIIDGNTSALQETVIGRVKNATWVAGEELILRWKDSNSAGTDGMISIDDVVVVPEPATMAIFGLGLAGLLGRKRKNS